MSWTSPDRLDIARRLDVLSLVRGSRLTVLAALHDLNLAAAHCDLLYVVADGCVRSSGPPRDVLQPALLADVFGVRAHPVRHPETGAVQLPVRPPPHPIRTPMRKLLAAVLCLATTAAVSGCGADLRILLQGRPRSSAVTLTNCGRKVAYDKVPERVVTNDVGITELMFGRRSVGAPHGRVSPCPTRRAT